MRALTVIWLLAACGSPPRAVPTTAPASPTAPVRGPDGISPEATAGLYWLPYVTCDDCAKPAAIVAYVTTDEDAARRITHSLAGNLGFGLPYVIHTDEIDIEPRGIAVVTGTYATLVAAKAAARGKPAIDGNRAAAIDLEQQRPGDGAAESSRHVTVVDRGPPVLAWSKQDVETVKAALDASDDPAAHETIESQRAWIQRALQARRPACRVNPGDLFVVDDSEIDWYELAPVRCAGKPAYIAWTSSLLGHAVIVPDDAGWHISQVVGAICDSPTIRDWPYDGSGRHPTEEMKVIVASGC